MYIYVIYVQIHVYVYECTCIHLHTYVCVRGERHCVAFCIPHRENSIENTFYREKDPCEASDITSPSFIIFLGFRV